MKNTRKSTIRGAVAGTVLTLGAYAAMHFLQANHKTPPAGPKQPFGEELDGGVPAVEHRSKPLMDPSFIPR